MKITNVVAYLTERFPPVNMALFAVLFLTVYSVAQSVYPAAPFGWREGLGMVAVISFFFRLRVFDEHKDYDIDVVNHPRRALQSGRVTLAQLARLSLILSLSELVWSVWMGRPTVVAWLAAVGYSLLMRYEFFARTYLTQRLLLYAVTHMLIMPLVIAWVWSAYAPLVPVSGPLGLLATLSLLCGFAFEIARKIHAPDAERPTVDSYSKSMGYGPAIGAVLLLLGGSVVAQTYLLTSLQAGTWPFVLIAALYAATLIAYGLSLRTPREKTLKLAGLLVSLCMLFSYLSIILLVQL